MFEAQFMEMQITSRISQFSNNPSETVSIQNVILIVSLEAEL